MGYEAEEERRELLLEVAEFNQEEFPDWTNVKAAAQALIERLEEEGY